MSIASAAAVRANAGGSDVTTESRAARNGVESSLQLSFACSRSELLESQRLRYRVFAEELGVRLPGPIEGVDADAFDLYCEHLLVRDVRTGAVVGSYRMLRPEQAAAIGRYYADQEFDLTRLHSLRPRMVELGRACVAPGYRTGPVIRLLWAGIARFMLENGYTHLIGCASIDARDGGHRAASVFWALYPSFASTGTLAAHPHVRFPLDRTVPYLDPAIPGLIRGYLRSGARICGMPAWDPTFRSADLLMLLDMKDLPLRLARHFGVADGLQATGLLPIAA